MKKFLVVGFSIFSFTIYSQILDDIVTWEFSQKQITDSLNHLGAKFEVMDDISIIKATVKALMEGKAIGWYQGRMEFGPRALGSRSIIADPRNDTMQKILNLKVKYR